MLVWSSSVFGATLSGSLSWNTEDDRPPQRGGYWSALHPFAVQNKARTAVPAAVWILQRIGDPLPVESDSVELVIENLAFSRDLIAVRSNTILNLNNRSRYTLTLQLLDSDRHPLDGVVLAPDGAGRVTVPTEGVFVLQAAEFSHLFTTVVVTPRGREIAPEADGRFVLSGIDAGRYRLLVWAGHWVEGKPFDIIGDSAQVTVLADARRGMVVGITVKVAINPMLPAPPEPPVPIAPPLPPPANTPVAPPRPATPPMPQAPQPPRTQKQSAQDGDSATDAPAPAKTAKPKSKPADSGSTPAPASDDSGSDGGFFKIKELD
jgi:hypothetical protein